MLLFASLTPPLIKDIYLIERFLISCYQLHTHNDYTSSCLLLCIGWSYKMLVEKPQNHIKYSKFIMFCMTNTKSSTHSKLNELNNY